MSYVRKLGASALVVAAAFAVAFAVLVSSTSTQTAEAADVPVGDGDNAATAAPGDSVQFTVTAELAQVTITATAAGVGASFAANDGQTIACADGTSCDKDGTDDGSVRVDMNVDADAGEGYILVEVKRLGIGSPTSVTKVITVSKAGLVGSLELKTDAATDKTIPAIAGTSNLTATVKNASSPAGGLAGQSVTIITTHGTVGCGTGAGSASAGSTQTCSIVTDAAGIVDVVLTGGGVEGVATVTATLGTRTSEATVTMFGTAKNLTAEAEQGSVEIGGSVFIVLTVTDGAGNPVSGTTITPLTSKEVVGPADDAVLVTTEKDSTGTETGDAAGTGYSRDKIAAKAADNIPACGDDARGRNASPATEVFADANDGTNSAGQCVVYVTAPAAEGTQKAATRGQHTLNFQVTAAIKASATIEVAGAPASITTDAPATVDPGSVTEITVSVWDDEDVLVGITSVKVRKVDGGGLIEDESAADTPGSEKTADGQSKFTFIAPSSVGTSEILITAGKIDHRVSLQIGEPVVEPEPEPEPAPSLNKTPASTGFTAVSFSGGSIDELVAAVTASCGPSASIYGTSLGEYVGYFVGSPDFVNRGFNDLYADGIDANEAFLVGGCGS